MLLEICFYLSTLLSFELVLFSGGLSPPAGKDGALQPQASFHQSSGGFLLFNNSSKSLGVESQRLSLGNMTITKAMAMISLGHVHDSALGA